MERAEAYLHAKFHLDPSNRLATIHRHHRQTGQTGQRTDSIGRTVLQTVAQKSAGCRQNIQTRLVCTATERWTIQPHANIPRVCFRVFTGKPASVDKTARRQFQATGQPVSRPQASDAMTSRLPRYEAKCVQRMCFQWGSVFCVQISRERS